MQVVDFVEIFSYRFGLDDDRKSKLSFDLTERVGDEIGLEDVDIGAMIELYRYIDIKYANLTVADIINVFQTGVKITAR